MSKRADEILYGLFYDTLRSVGMVFNPQQAEQLRSRSEKLAKQFERMIRVISVSVVDQLQKATLSGFEKTDKKFQDQEEKFKLLKEALTMFNELNTKVNLVDGKVEALAQQMREDALIRSRSSERPPLDFVSKDR